MHPSDRQLGFRIVLRAATVCAAFMALVGCGSTSKPKAAPTRPPRYATLPPRQVPEFLKDTIFERCDVIDTEPKLISGFGVVARLNNTADNTLVPTTVRNYIIREMVKHGFGSKLQPGFEEMQPEEMLRSATVSIVRVDGYIQPGARKGDRFDLQVSALPGTNTTSLSRGVLYRTELKVNGAFVQQPGYEVDIAGFGEGPVFVNPAYALDGASPKTDQAKQSLRYGIVMNGGLVMNHRPLLLRVRQPQRSLARAIELLIEQRFAILHETATDKIAAAKDEGIVYVQVPEQFHGDWQHFAQVVTHMYLETRPGTIAQKASRLAEEAAKPGAPLLDISYCWEAIGTPALEYIQPLLASDDPDLRYAAARAAAYIRPEPSAIATLMSIAVTKGDPFQLNAIQVLGDIPDSPIVRAEIRKLLDSNENTVRVQAYNVLAAKGDLSVYSTPIGRTSVGPKFTLDIVPSNGPPMIYASRRGPARIAILGTKPSIGLPAMFTAMDNQLSISSAERANTLTIFYRGIDIPKPIRVAAYPDIADVTARLGGAGAPGDPTLNFSYADVVAILQGLCDARQVSSVINGQHVPAAFVMQEAPSMEQDIINAPVIPEQGRPEGEGGRAVGMNDVQNGLKSQ